MIQKQEITLSNARMIAPVLTSKNQDKWLSAAAKLSKRVLEKEIAHQFPERGVQEQTRYVSENRIELRLGISEELHALFKQAQDILSSQMRNHSSLEETLEAALEFYIERGDPQKKAERAQKRELTSAKTLHFSPVPGQVKLPNPRFVPARLEHLVRLRDQGQCTHRAPTGNRCAEKRWLEIHHIHPLSKGGETRLDNLTLVCRGHHQLVHH